VLGSVARGEADARSGIDFLVDMEPGRSLLDLGGLHFDLAALLAPPVDVVTDRGLKARICERVLRGPAPHRSNTMRSNAPDPMANSPITLTMPGRRGS
jgi:uncharacterized protein